MINRKEFLKRMGTLAGASLLGKIGLAGTHSSNSFLETSSFDLHCHPGAFFSKGAERYPGDAFFHKTVNDMHANGLGGAFFGLVADWPLLKLTDKGVETTGRFQKGDGWRACQQQLANLKELLKDSKASLVSSYNQLPHDKVAAFIAIEGGDFLDGEIGYLEEVYAEGVRSVQVVHYVQNDLGDLQTEKPVYNGLSKFGKRVVKRMNRLGMVIDVAHASFDTVKDVAKLTKDPIILSHSILKMDPGRPISARAISEEHAKLVSDTGGVIGLWPSGFSKSFDEFVESSLRLIDLVGIDHVGMGTDMDGNYKPVIANYGDFDRWAEALLDKGLLKAEVQKIAGGNMHRVLKEVLKS